MKKTIAKDLIKNRFNINGKMIEDFMVVLRKMILR